MTRNAWSASALGSPDHFEPGRLRIVALTGDGDHACRPGDRRVADGGRSTGMLCATSVRTGAEPSVEAASGAPCCPRLPGTLEYGLDGKILVCPWHQHEFDIESGECLFIDDHARLVKYPVEVADGEVRVQVTAIGPAVGGVDRRVVA
jgi:hypothetical protein